MANDGCWNYLYALNAGQQSEINQGIDKKITAGPPMTKNRENTKSEAGGRENSFFFPLSSCWQQLARVLDALNFYFSNKKHTKEWPSTNTTRTCEEYLVQISRISRHWPAHLASHLCVHLSHLPLIGKMFISWLKPFACFLPAHSSSQRASIVASWLVISPFVAFFSRKRGKNYKTLSISWPKVPWFKPRAKSFNPRHWPITWTA